MNILFQPIVIMGAVVLPFFCSKLVEKPFISC